MKLELDLPDWVDGKGAIRIFKGVELVAKKMPGGPWEIKTVRCDFCGRCCMNKIQPFIPGITVDPDSGYCGALIPKPDEPGKYLCALGSNRPFSCSAYSGGENDRCCVEWKIVE